MILSVLDIGSNTTKVLVVRECDRGKFAVVGEKSIPLRLANFLFGNLPCLPDEAINETLETISFLLEFSSEFNPQAIAIVGTETLRKVSNVKELSFRIKERFSLDLRVLSGEEEASGVVKGLLTDPSVHSFDQFCAIDLGGGSLEMVKVVDRRCESKCSLPLGAVVLAREFLGDLNNRPKKESLMRLADNVHLKLMEKCSDFFDDRINLVGTGGALLYLRKIISSEKNKAFEDSQIMNFADIQKVNDKLVSMTLKERKSSFPDLPSDRADIFPAALTVIVEFMKIFEKQIILHSFHNLRYGIASELLESHGKL